MQVYILAKIRQSSMMRRKVQNHLWLTFEIVIPALLNTVLAKSSCSRAALEASFVGLVALIEVFGLLFCFSLRLNNRFGHHCSPIAELWGSVSFDGAEVLDTRGAISVELHGFADDGADRAHALVFLNWEFVNLLKEIASSCQVQVFTVLEGSV